ncbi:MAG: hypothetical protein Q7U60_07690 [Candidatus Methanoperedens sp.]|nr:hypothetical protein [Candidatus Methanoperedens sp.]
MDPKYKTLIPLIIIFFIFGIVVGYVAHKPQTIEIEKIVEKEKIVTVIVTPSPTPALATPTPTPTPTAIATPAISDFTVKNYEPSKDTPTKTIELTSNGANPSALSIRPGDTVLIKITDYTLQSPLTLILNATYSRNLGTGGAVVVTFNKKGTYIFKAIIPSSDPNILPKSYADGTITVY